MSVKILGSVAAGKFIYENPTIKEFREIIKDQPSYTKGQIRCFFRDDSFVIWDSSESTHTDTLKIINAEQQSEYIYFGKFRISSTYPNKIIVKIDYCALDPGTGTTRLEAEVKLIAKLKKMGFDCSGVDPEAPVISESKNITFREFRKVSLLSESKLLQTSDGTGYFRNMSASNLKQFVKNSGKSGIRFLAFENEDGNIDVSFWKTPIVHYNMFQKLYSDIADPLGMSDITAYLRKGAGYMYYDEPTDTYHVTTYYRMANKKEFVDKLSDRLHLDIKNMVNPRFNQNGLGFYGDHYLGSFV